MQVTWDHIMSQRDFNAQSVSPRVHVCHSKLFSPCILKHSCRAVQVFILNIHLSFFNNIAGRLECLSSYIVFCVNYRQMLYNVPYKWASRFISLTCTVMLCHYHSYSICAFVLSRQVCVHFLFNSALFSAAEYTTSSSADIITEHTETC